MRSEGSRGTIVRVRVRVGVRVGVRVRVSGSERGRKLGAGGIWLYGGSAGTEGCGSRH